VDATVSDSIEFALAALALAISAADVLFTTSALEQ